MATLEEVLASVTTLLARYSTAVSVDGGSKLLTLNRAGAGDTAAVVLQQGGAERFRMGQIGADTFALQRSPTGSAVDYTDVLSVNRSTGAVTITGLVSEGATLSGLSLFTGDVEIANTVASLRLKDTNDANQAFTRIYSYSGVCIVDVDPNNNGESSSSFRVHTDGVERFRVDALGRVGFKTSAPAYDVDVNGSFGVRGATILHGNVILNTDDFRLYPSTSDGADTARVAILAGGAFSSNRGAYIFACGNEHATDPGNIVISAGAIAGSEVRLSGVGGVKVLSNFEVSGSGSFSTQFTGNGAVFSRDGPNYIDALTGSALIAYRAKDSHRFEVGGAERMRVTATGVGIGTTSPVSLVDARGAVSISPSAFGTWIPPLGFLNLLSGSSANNTSVPLLSMLSDSVNNYATINCRRFAASTQIGIGFSVSTGSGPYEAMVLDYAGRLLIGTSTPGASKLRISGLPTSAAGLAAGDIWNDGGTLKVA